MNRIRLTALLLMVSHVISAQNRSDSEAVSKLALDVMNRMGGRENFDSTHYIGWNFFGTRQIIWDKLHNRVRVDYLKKKITIIADIEGDECRVFINEVESMHPDSINKYRQRAKLIWMNDSYWLIMPFKLLDPGVTLTSLGQVQLNDSTSAEVLEMTFDAVGATPQNKYRIYIDDRSGLIVRWDFYEKSTDPEPEFSNSWGNYQQYGNILLSDDRGEEGKLSDIHVWDTLPEEVFTNLKIPQLSEL